MRPQDYKILGLQTSMQILELYLFMIAVILRGSPYSHAEMRDVSSSKFTRVVFAVTVNGNGSTSKVIFKNEDGRTIEIEGAFSN